MYKLKVKYFRILISPINPLCTLHSINGPIAVITVLDDNEGSTRQSIRATLGSRMGRRAEGMWNEVMKENGI